MGNKNLTKFSMAAFVVGLVCMTLAVVLPDGFWEKIFLAMGNAIVLFAFPIVMHISGLMSGMA